MGKRTAWVIFVFLLLTHAGTALYRTIVQYRAWEPREVTRMLLTLPVDASVVPEGVWFNRLGSLVGGKPNGYFLYYSYGRFWLRALISILLPGFVFLVFAVVARIRSSGLPYDLTIPLLLGMLAAGWPRVLVFVPFFLLFSLGAFAVGRRPNGIVLALSGVAATLVTATSILAALRLAVLYI